MGRWPWRWHRRKPVCCECGGSSHSDYLVPFARRRRALLFVCHECYTNHDYDYYFFKPPREIANEA